MKQEQRFEKVVEWKEEPNYLFIFFGFFLIFCGISFTNVSDSFSNVVTCAALSAIGIILFYSNLGRGRKVYWRKIE